MKKYFIILILLVIVACQSKPQMTDNKKIGLFSGLFEHGNFSDTILFNIERDSTNWKVFFTSLEQNANGIPIQNVEVEEDSINFKLQSDFYTYTFKNKWIDNYTKLAGSLTVDTTTTKYILNKEVSADSQTPKHEEVVFESNGFNLNGTIWYPKESSNKGLVIVTSSGNADRSGSRAEAILFAKRGFTTFHYDKRGTGNSQGDWESITVEDLASDDINAIRFFSNKTSIMLSNTGIKGSSQGGAKIPYILDNLQELNYGIVVSCPGVTLLESDLNYWKNRNLEIIGADIEDATKLQGKVFEHIAGKLTKVDLEKAIEVGRSEPWFTNIWVPNLDEVKIDKKLLYSPIPYFEKVKQPLLVIQGTSDEIIPPNSHELITNSLNKANNHNYEIVLLEGGSHSMYYVGKSDFPYWSKLHPKYLMTMEGWINTVTKLEE